MTELDDEHDDLYCWKVHGTTDEFTGYYAEEEANAVAKRIGGTAFAFPLYVRPQPADEPVAWLYDWKAEGITLSDCVSLDYDEAHSPTMGCHNIRPLYTRPQPAREWIDLTEEEAARCWTTSTVKTWKNIETALKEKNT
jgi:hypothetical protein